MILALPLTRARIELSLRQPSWLTRSEWETVRPLEPSIDEELVVEYLLECKDLIRRRIEGLPKFQPDADIKPDVGDQGPHSASGSGHGQTKSCLERVWFWFPSLSSKEKRRDLVTFAEEHLLSGFLLAGEFTSPLIVLAPQSPLDASRHISQQDRLWSLADVFRQTWSTMRRRMRERSGSVHVTYKIGKLVRYPTTSEKGISSIPICPDNMNRRAAVSCMVVRPADIGRR